MAPQEGSLLMHLHSPERPWGSNGQPQYITPDGHAIAVISRLELWPEPDGSWTIGGFWCHQQGVARGYWLESRPLAECLAWAERFAEGPEAAMAELGWSWRGGGGRGSRAQSAELDIPPSAVSLGDLGL